MLLYFIQSIKYIVRCENGWTMFKNGCYKFFPEEKAWNEAKSTCEHDNGQLTSIHSKDEMDFLRCQQDPASVHTTWVGGQRQYNGFQWVDGTSFDFDNWYMSQPDNQGGNENCLQVHANPGQDWHDKWSDAPCDEKRNFICKKKPVGGK